MNRFGIFNLLVAIGLLLKVSGVSAIDCTSSPRRTDLQACCPHDNLISDEIVDMCMHSHSSQQSSHMHIPNACQMECALNATGVMIGGYVDEFKLNNYLSTVLIRNPEMLPIVQIAFANCAQKINAICEMMTMHPPPGMQRNYAECSACAGVLMNCIKLETIFNCTPNIWRNDEDCNNHKEFYKTCSPPISPHSH